MASDGWWPGKGFAGGDERLNFLCSKGHEVRYTVVEQARQEQVRCAACGEVGPR
jgi:hypothetical protein